uniref:hypothetical protein n=1 Tax=Burkholderia arboris TaxID=488730 RepID=UPI003BEF0164
MLDRVLDGPLAIRIAYVGRIGDDAVMLEHRAIGFCRQYVEFATDYYDRNVDRGDVAAVYRHEPLTPALAGRLNPELDLESIEDDLIEIGYPSSTSNKGGGNCTDP